jgi:MFS family permease
VRITPPAGWLDRLTSRRGVAMDEMVDPPTPDELHNAKILRSEAPFTSLAFGAGSSFYALFAIQLGGSNALVGWLTAGPALINLLWLLPCGRLVQRLPRLCQGLMAGAAVHRLFLLALVAVPFLPPSARAWAIVGIVTVSSVPATLWAIAFHTSVAELFSRRHFARLIGQRWAVANVASVVGTLVMGALVDAIRFPLNFQILFVGLGLVTLSTSVIVMRLRFPARCRPATRAPALAGGVRAFRADPLFRTFVMFESAILCTYLSLYAATPLFRIYWVRDLHASGTWVAALAAAAAVGASAGNLLWGRWTMGGGDRRNLALAASGLLGVYPMLTSLVGSLSPLLLVGLLGGFFAGGHDLLMYKRIASIPPADQRATYIAVHNMTVNIAAFVGPLVSTALIAVIGVRPVMALVGGLGAVASVVLYFLGWGKTAEELATQPAAT